MMTTIAMKPKAVSYSQPYAFDGPYAACFATEADRRMAMDKRHIHMMHAVLMSHPFTRALELGSWKGASTSAFFEAIRRGHKMWFDFCDTMLQPELLACWQQLHPRQAAPFWDYSWSVLSLAKADRYDFIFVDANHDLASVQKELAELVRLRPLCLMAHDTNATAAGFPHAEGAALLKRTFIDLPGYLCVEDAAKRPGEQTERGLFLATTDPAIHEAATSIFARMGGMEPTC